MRLLESLRTLIFCRLLATVILALLCAWYLQAKMLLLASLYGVGFLLFLVASLSPTLLGRESHQQVLHGLLLVYTCVSIVLLASPESYLSPVHLSLHFAFPLIALGLARFRLAIILVAGFALAFNLLIMLQLDGTLRVTVLTTFWMITLLGIMSSFAHQQRQRQLERYLSKDPATGLLNRQQLSRDLNREIERARREKTALGLVTVELKGATSKQAALAIQQLQASLAAYERLYSPTAGQLVVLLPLGKEQQLQERFASLGENNPELVMSACCSTLDTAESSLTQPAELVSHGAVVSHGGIHS